MMCVRLVGRLAQVERAGLETVSKSIRAREGEPLDVSLDGKVALVTGAGPNIGSGIALALSRYGARVACNDLVPDAAKAAVRRVSRNGGTGLALSGDVS